MRIIREGAMALKRLNTQQRKEIFHALVASQDELHSVRKSYEQVTEQFAISEEELREIEDEGVDNEWPPLREEAVA
jgi:hypothetical protein